MAVEKTIVALIYDFDGTLSPLNMQEYGLIEALGETTDEFWGGSNRIGTENSMSCVLAYMKYMMDFMLEIKIMLIKNNLMIQLIIYQILYH